MDFTSDVWTREEIEAIEVGAIALDDFEQVARVTHVVAHGEDLHGKAFVVYRVRRGSAEVGLSACEGCKKWVRTPAGTVRIASLRDEDGIGVPVAYMVLKARKAVEVPYTLRIEHHLDRALETTVRVELFGDCGGPSVPYFMKGVDAAVRFATEVRD